MIRRLKEQDRQMVLDYLYVEPTYNIFLIGDIEQFGFDQPFQQLYGGFNQDDILTSVFLRYRDNGVYYSQDNAFDEMFLPTIQSFDFEHFSGKPLFIDAIHTHIPGYLKRQMYFCEWTHQPIEQTTHSVQIKTLETKKECAKLYDLLVLIDDFSIAKQGKDTFINNKLQSKVMSTTLYIEQDGIVVSTVATTAETTINAMVVAVATHPDYRQKGYATVLMEELQVRFHNKNKSLCLFYDNPKAGAIYHRLGFETIGPWSLLERRNNNA